MIELELFSQGVFVYDRAVEMALKFPHAKVIGMDLIQSNPRSVAFYRPVGTTVLTKTLSLVLFQRTARRSHQHFMAIDTESCTPCKIH